MLYTLLLLASIHAATVAGATNAKCAAQYAAVAKFVSSNSAALAFCSSKVRLPTAIVTVTSTVHPQKRAAPTDDDAPIPFSDVPAGLYAYAAANKNNKPHPADAKLVPGGVDEGVKAPARKENERRQVNWGAYWSSYYYNQMSSQENNPWVAAVCSCIVSQVTRTVTARVTATSTKTSTSSTRPPAITSSTLRTSASAVTARPSTSAYVPPPPPNPLAGTNCLTGPYNGTGACACDYTVVCGYAGTCGSASQTAVTAAASWQLCAQTCDDNSACSAWTYDYGTGKCTEVVDQGCDSDGFSTVAEADAVVGVYSGGCTGVCLS